MNFLHFHLFNIIIFKAKKLFEYDPKRKIEGSCLEYNNRKGYYKLILIKFYLKCIKFLKKKKIKKTKDQAFHNK